MNLEEKIFYNVASAKKLNWEPYWFGGATGDYCKAIDEDFIDTVIEWQKEHGLEGDGLVGPGTFRRAWTERESTISSGKPLWGFSAEDKTIVHNGKHFPIEWNRVVLWDEGLGVRSQPGNYTSHAGKPDRKPNHFVNHWDACLSAKSCASVLNKRGISIHFLIDNDGTIYQMLDTQHGAWHAGHKYGNRQGIGVEISNAYYTKYQETYVKRGYAERPVLEDAEVHGRKMDPFLGFYPEQLKALQALWKAVHLACDIPLECPTNENGELITTVDRDCDKGRFDGFICHYHLTKRKIDCAGLDLVGLLDEVKSTL